ncbi:MAG: endolytic transglycosylase MltG [Lutibacter sp.]|nr:endolytic transglycosylase MltG [Lutibacter sp.]MBP9600088.1 endolytic transglycosylase MltG [Lutibacter sp.]
MNLKKLYIYISIIFVILIGFIGFNTYNKFYKANIIEDGYLYIPTNSTYDDVETIVRPFLERVNTFNFVSSVKRYSDAIKPGKYKIEKGMSNNALINMLRNGKQSMVKLSFNNQDSLEKLAGRIAEQIEADSISLLQVFNNDAFLQESGFTKNTALAMFIPNTYEFYWNTSAELFQSKMKSEFDRFWNAERIESAKKLNLTPLEVTTLASIVQKETSSVKERPSVAKLYLNRLNDGWPLQADPTVIFAVKQSDPNAVIKRVLKKDLTVASPYNTYVNLGLPPGPIAMPDISSIDAVLTPANHNYFYMCASVEKIGTHEFATTLPEHNRNAAKYQTWLNQQGVNR